MYLGVDTTVTMDVRLGYRDRDAQGNWTKWKELARSMEERPLKCEPDHVCITHGLSFLSTIVEVLVTEQVLIRLLLKQTISD